MHQVPKGLDTVLHRARRHTHGVSRRLCCPTLQAVIWLVLGLASSNVAAYDVPFHGIIAQSGVLANSGAGRIYYPTANLSAGTIVRVEQVIQGWYKIPLPEGNYSFVSKVFVDARGDGTTGVVNRNRTAVKAVNIEDEANSYRTQTSLSKGFAVRILGETHNYYKIESPGGVFAFVPQSAVRIATDDEIHLAQQKDQDPHPEPLASATEPAVTAVTPHMDLIQPESPPNTQSVEPQPGSLLAEVEKRFHQIPKRPVHTLAIDELLADDRRLAAKRLQAPSPGQQNLNESRTKHLHHQSIPLEPMGEVNRTSGADPLFARTGVRESRTTGSPARSIFQHDAVGWLRVSDVYNGKRLPRLYRLADPATDRTIAYVRANAKVNAAIHLGRLVALKGETSFDADLKLRVLDVEAVEAVRLASP